MLVTIKQQVQFTVVEVFCPTSLPHPPWCWWSGFGIRRNMCTVEVAVWSWYCPGADYHRDQAVMVSRWRCNAERPAYSDGWHDCWVQTPNLSNGRTEFTENRNFEDGSAFPSLWCVELILLALSMLMTETGWTWTCLEGKAGMLAHRFWHCKSHGFYFN